MISGGFIQDLDPVQTTPTGPTMEPTVAQPLNPADLNGIIDATIGSLSESLAQKSLNLETDFPEELPLLSVERDTIARIVFDLVEHAIETSPSGSSIHMEVKLRKQDGAEGNLLFTITHPYPEIAGSSPGGSSPFEGQPSNPPDQATLITRLGLSELKALVETFHGGFRADILPEGNAALNLLLPIQAEEKPSAGLDE
jgi:K+-sensing histidine kinase KdpD